MLTRIARTSFRHRRLVLAAWIVAFALAIAGGSALAATTQTADVSRTPIRRLPMTASRATFPNNTATKRGSCSPMFVTIDLRSTPTWHVSRTSKV